MSSFLLRYGVSKQTGYTTLFNTAESPIREGGKWKSPGATAFTSTATTTKNGAAFGDPASSGTNDSVLQLVGNDFLLNQTIIATVSYPGTKGSAEIELHARSTELSSTQVTLYECDCGVGGITMAKWMGAQGSVVVFNWDTGTGGGNYLGGSDFADGDQFKFTCIGDVTSTVLTVYQKRVADGGFTMIGRVTDTGSQGNVSSGTNAAPFITGNPGMGFDVGAGGTWDAVGWADYTVTTTS